MRILLQIDLGEAREASPDLSEALPNGGLLQVFLAGEMPWDEGPIESIPGVRLVLHPVDATLVSKPGDGAPETSVAMRFEPSLTYAADDLPEGVGLILQIASDDELGWMFGDVGILYFMADLDAFARGRLENVHYAFQCS